MAFVEYNRNGIWITINCYEFQSIHLNLVNLVPFASIADIDFGLFFLSFGFYVEIGSLHILLLETIQTARQNIA